MSSSRRRYAEVLDVSEPALTCEYFTEPKLEFADRKLHVDPKLGILRYGPKSLTDGNRHPRAVRVGLVGTAQSVETAQNWLNDTSLGSEGDEKHPEFPGFAKDRGFFSELQFDGHWVAQLSHSEVAEVLETRPKKRAFESLLCLLDAKLKLLAGQDLPPQYIVLCVPTDVFDSCHTVDYHDGSLGGVHRDLRRAFKALAMKYRIPTQVLRERTAAGLDKDHYSKIAWNFFTGLYFKAGGFPWGPVGLAPGTCYMGVSFFKPLGTAQTKVQTSLVQAFDEHGEGLVLRGHDFEWDAERQGTSAPHLSEEQAGQLVELVLDRYQREMKQTPQRLVVHKTSRFWEVERRGFQEAIRNRVQQYDLVALAPQSRIRLLPMSDYPPLRGTRFSVGDLDFLYTTGFISDLGQFHSLHVPSALEIADHVGSDSPRGRIIREVLILTKMNWNSARLGGLLPITLRFSRLVGNILKEMAVDVEPLTNYKFYM